MKKILNMFLGLSVLLTPLAVALPAQAVTPWDTTGSYTVSFDGFVFDMNLVQDGLGNLTGGGGYPAGSLYFFVLAIASGTVEGDIINITANYTQGAIGTTVHMTGTIAPNGSMSGVWDDNYGGGTRTGTWTTVSGTASNGALLAEDFGVVNYDTGLGFLKGYTSGFGLTDATLADTTSVVVKLYSSGDVLLQTNTAIMPAFSSLPGNQFSSPFDVSGNFDYATDGYWTNVRQAQYGQSVPATKVVATVTLDSGSILTATNTNLTGNPSDIFPVGNVAPVLSDVTSPVTIPELSPFSFDANATDADGDTLTFSAIGMPTGATLDPLTGVFNWTPSEVQGPGDYTFGIRVSDGSLGDGQSITIHVTEVDGNPTPTSPQTMDDCKNGGWMTFTNPPFRNQGLCVSWTNHEWTWTPGTQGQGLRGYTPESVTTSNGNSNGNSDHGQSGRRFVTEVNSGSTPTTPGNSGNSNGRSIRMFATGTSGESTPTTPGSENECRDGGWITFNSPAFRSQGQCISWVINH